MRRGLKTIVYADAAGKVPPAVQQHLEEAGYRLICHTDGSSVLWDCENRPPHLLILDSRLRDMDGMDVCGYLRESPVCPDLPILMLTEPDDEMARAYARQMADYVGADFFLAKPYDPNVLLQLIDDIVRGTAQRGQSRVKFPTRVVWPTNCVKSMVRMI